MIKWQIEGIKRKDDQPHVSKRSIQRHIAALFVPTRLSNSFSFVSFLVGFWTPYVRIGWVKVEWTCARKVTIEGYLLVTERHMYRASPEKQIVLSLDDLSIEC